MAILVDTNLFSFQAGPLDEQAGGTAFTDPFLSKGSIDPLASLLDLHFPLQLKI